MRRLKDESGQVMIVTILSMSLLIGFLALAVDVGTLFRAKRLMQTAADSAAIAAAQEWQYGDGRAAANAAAAQNGVGGTYGGTVTINNGPASGPYVGNTDYYEAIVSQSQTTFFGKIFTGSIFRDAVAVTGRAVATLGNGQSCVYTLGTAGTGIAWNGSGTVNLPTCSLLDDSDSSTALTFNGSGTLSAQSIGVVGGYSFNGSGTLSPRPPTVIAPVANPLASLTPPANPGGCTTPTIPPSLPYTMTPGCYNGIAINGSGTVTFSAGLYYVNGPFSINGSGTISGTNVTFYFPNSNNASFSQNGSGTLDLSAPTTGPNNGMLFYQDPNNNNPMTFNGSGTQNLQGIIYAAGAALTLNGSASSQFYTGIVTRSLTFNGSGTLKDYAVKNGASPLTAARLVE
jgi:Flp pilus assembly protein TadG